MFLIPADKAASRTTKKLVQILSCTAVLLSMLATGPEHKPNPGIRTAFRLLAANPTHQQPLTLETPAQKTKSRAGPPQQWETAVRRNGYEI